MSGEIPAGVMWAIPIVVALCAYSFRLSFFLLFDRIDDVPSWVDTVLTYVAPAVLAALVLPQLVYYQGGVSLENPRLAAGAVTAVVAWRTRNLTVTVGVGMLAFWGFRGMI